MANRIWVDVEDLFQYATFNSRPSGIQRIELELCQALALSPDHGPRTGFLRHATGRNGFRIIPYSELGALHRRLVASPPPVGRAAPNTMVTAAAPGGLGRRIAYLLPGEIRKPLVDGAKAQARALVAAGILAAALGQCAARTFRERARRRVRGAQAAAGPAPSPDVPFGPQTMAGDVLLSLGSPWFHPFYAELTRTAAKAFGLRLGVLVYDTIPLQRPEWCEENLVRRFESWARTALPDADHLLTISEASGRDLLGWARRNGLSFRRTPHVIPIGTGFGDRAAPEAAAPARRSRLPPPDSYVLMVSTLEARKNHALLFRIWRKLLEEMEPARVPTLVFAGRVGWLVSDLVEQIRRTNGLDGKLLLIEDATDAELAQLYRGCRFTLFPSFYEGWGLPVTESHGYGRPCLASSASAVPEAGGALARYFDPENGTEALRMIRTAIEDEAGTRRWAEEVSRSFRPVSWRDSADAMVRHLDGDAAEAAPS